MNKYFVVLLISTLSLVETQAQKKETTPHGWHLMDKDSTGYYGVSANKAYNFIKAKNLKSKTVIVAVIDSGIDTLQEDLKPILWTNPKEIPGNGIDDDKNGYVDDVHGWNFLGGKDGRNVKEDSYEFSRVYFGLKDKYEGKEKENISPKDAAEFAMWERTKALVTEPSSSPIDLTVFKKLLVDIQKSDSILKIALGKDVFTGIELDNFYTTDSKYKAARNIILGLMKANNQAEATNKEFVDDFVEYVNQENNKDEAKKHAPENYRADIVKDDENNFNERGYGNNDIMAATAMHGTHTSGIIGAVRNNGVGVDGIADNVRIMMVRTLGDGDEHDKDVANAIRYAVDNGAQIISMSFGKDFSPHKQWVDDAMRYAESKNVLMVLAAGNDAKNLDNEPSFPNPNYIDGKGVANNLITVGASGDPKNGGIVGNFSNYGKKTVDVFAPGVRIYSTLPGGNNYGNEDGTSMACPLVAGIAALSLEYFPTLSVKQLKYVIEKSTVAPKYKVTKPGTDEMVNLSDLCKSGGIVNAYEAVKLAATLKGERKTIKEVLPKPKLIKIKKG